jgi:hypothetical protein
MIQLTRICNEIDGNKETLLAGYSLLMTGQVPFLSWAKLQTGFYEWSGKQSKIKNTTAGFALYRLKSLTIN